MESAFKSLISRVKLVWRTLRVRLYVVWLRIWGWIIVKIKFLAPREKGRKNSYD